MTWILIALVLVIAFGPVLWLVPSRKDRRLTALRARARTEGLLVDIRRLPKHDAAAEERVSPGGVIREPTVECAAYGRMLAKKLRYLPAWRLLRQGAGDSDDPFADWQFDLRPQGESRANLDPMLKLVHARLDDLPEDVIGFEVNSRSLFAYWLERPGSTVETVSAIAAVLADLEAELTALDGRLAPCSGNSDS